MRHRHLPYAITPDENRFHFYETNWKYISLQLLMKHLKPNGQSIFDYGCGRGETLKIFTEAGFQASGADVDPECVRLSSQFGPARLLDLNDPVAQFGPASFDVVTSFHVLEHVDNPKKTLNDLRQIARKYVLLAVPNLRYLHRLTHREIRLDGVNEGHLQAWDHWHLLNLAERHCGLELVEWSSDATMLPFVSMFANRFLGQKVAVRLETGLFRRMFPFHAISIIGLFRPKA
jgi:SAM-dependent methyltransferase